MRTAHGVNEQRIFGRARFFEQFSGKEKISKANGDWGSVMHGRCLDIEMKMLSTDQIDLLDGIMPSGK